MCGHTLRRPQVELVSSHLHSVKHVETAEYNMGLCMGTYMVLLIEYTALNYGYYGGRKTCMANTETLIHSVRCEWIEQHVALTDAMFLNKNMFVNKKTRQNIFFYYGRTGKERRGQKRVSVCL